MRKIFYFLIFIFAIFYLIGSMDESNIESTAVVTCTCGSKITGDGYSCSNGNVISMGSFCRPCAEQQCYNMGGYRR